MFKPYCIAMTSKGYRVFPPGAFRSYLRYRNTSAAVLIESLLDEALFLKFFGSGKVWLLSSAAKKGFGERKPPSA